jgi:hypothetical protein
MYVRSISISEGRLLEGKEGRKAGRQEKVDGGNGVRDCFCE